MNLLRDAGRSGCTDRMVAGSTHRDSEFSDSPSGLLAAKFLPLPGCIHRSRCVNGKTFTFVYALLRANECPRSLCASLTGLSGSAWAWTL